MGTVYMLAIHVKIARQRTVSVVGGYGRTTRRLLPLRQHLLRLSLLNDDAMSEHQKWVCYGKVTRLIDEFHRFLTLNAANRADFLIIEQHSIELVSCDKHLRSECRRDELSSRRKVVNHGCKAK